MVFLVHAGFGYRFDSLATAARALRRSRHSTSSPSIPAGAGLSGPHPPPPAPNDAVGSSEGESDEGEEEENELARAFGIIFSTARQFRIFTILQVWFPILRRFVSAFSVNNIYQRNLCEPGRRNVITIRCSRHVRR